MNVLRDLIESFSDWSPLATRDGGPATSFSSFYIDSERYHFPGYLERKCYRERKGLDDGRSQLIEELHQRNTLLSQTTSALERDIAELKAELERAKRIRDDAVQGSEGLRAQNIQLERALLEAHDLVHSQDEDAAHLRADNAALHAACAEAEGELREQATEMRTLRAFLTKTDSWTGQQVLQAVADL
jgi:chromosome segregation ATPase